MNTPSTSQGRKRSVLLGASSGYLSTLVTTILSFVTVPLALGYFGTEKYGALVLMGTFAGYLAIAGLGIPAASLVLAGRLTDRLHQLLIIGKGALLTGGWSLLLLPAVLFIGESESLLKLIGRIPESISGEVGQALFWSLVMFLVNRPFTALYNGFIAIGKPHLERLYVTLTAATYLVALAVTVWRRGSLTDLILIKGALSILVGVAGGIHFCTSCTERQSLRKALTLLARRDDNPELSTRKLIATGGTFFAGGIAMMIIHQTDNLVISHLLGIDAVTPYQITYRLMTLGFILFMAFTPALLPLYGRAWVEHDHGWIERTANTMLRFSAMLGGLIWVGCAAFAEPVIGVWAGTAAYGGLLMVLALGGYGFSLAVASQLAVLLTSQNRIRNIPKIRWIEAGSNLLLSLVLVRVLGAGGAALGTCVASLITISWLLPREIDTQCRGRVEISYRPVVAHLCGTILPALSAVVLVNGFVPWTFFRWGANLGIIGAYALFSIRQLPAADRSLLKGLRPSWEAADTDTAG